MISKEVLQVSKKLTEFGANHVTVPIFASIIYFTIKDMQMYCLDMEFFNDECIKEEYPEDYEFTEKDIKEAHEKHKKNKGYRRLPK